MPAQAIWHAQMEAARRGHVNASGLIDRVNEYAAAIPGLPA